MAAPQGGYRRPSSPAPVSGPGSMSQRTDGGPAKPMYVDGLPYGEGQAFYDLQTSAPLGAEAAKPRINGGRPAQGGPSSPAVGTPLFAPTGRPSEPVTAGAPVGPGPSSSPTVPKESIQAALQRMMSSDPSNDTAALLSLAQRLGY